VDPGQLARGGQVLRGDVPLVHGHVPVVALQPGAALGRRGPGGGEDDLYGPGGELAGLLEHGEQPHVLLAGERLAGLVPAFGQLHVLLPGVAHDRLGRVGQRERLAVGPLVVRVGVPGHLGREVGHAGRDDLLVFLQGGAGRADHRDDQARVVDPVDPAAVHRVAVQGHPGRLGVQVGPVPRRGAVHRHEHVIDADAVGTAGVHAEHGPVAPVVQDRDLLARDDHGDAVGRVLDQGVAHEVGGVGDAGAVVPGAGDVVAALGRLGGAHGRRTVGAAEVA
jgi:hypothetical protein